MSVKQSAEHSLFYNFERLSFAQLFAYISCALLVTIRLQQESGFNNSCDIREFITSNH